MDRIIGKGSKYLNTSVILLVADFNGAQEIIFEKRNSEISQGNEICLPGGRIDESIDTTPEQAAIREACEATWNIAGQDRCQKVSGNKHSDFGSGS